MLHPSAIVRGILKKKIPERELSKFNISIFVWDRVPEENKVSIAHSKNMNFSLAAASHYASYKKNSNAGKDIGKIPCDIENYEPVFRRIYMDSQKDEGGISSRVESKSHEFYIPMIDFNPGLDKNNRHTLDFWKAVEDKYSNERLYLFNSGNAHHGYLDTLFEDDELYHWLKFLSDYDIVDQKWVKFAQDCEEEYGGVLRWSIGLGNRIVPKYWKSILL